MQILGSNTAPVVEVLDHPASDKAPFGQAVRARSADGGGWLGWFMGAPLGRECLAVTARP